MAHPEPLEIIAGDTLTWIRRDVEAAYENDAGEIQYEDIKASEGWTLKYVAVGQLGSITITASADTDDPDDFCFTATAAVTAAYVVGDYKWQIVATKTTTRYTIDSGVVSVTDNIAGRSALYDNRSHAKKMLDAIQAVLEGRATSDVAQYSISGRSIVKMPILDLLRMKALYAAEYESEQAADRIAAGLNPGNKIRTRFI